MILYLFPCYLYGKKFLMGLLFTHLCQSLFDHRYFIVFSQVGFTVHRFEIYKHKPILAYDLEIAWYISQIISWGWGWRGWGGGGRGGGGIDGWECWYIKQWRSVCHGAVLWGMGCGGNCVTWPIVYLRGGREEGGGELRRWGGLSSSREKGVMGVSNTGYSDQ